MGEQSKNDLGLHSAFCTMNFFSGLFKDYVISSHNSTICHLRANTIDPILCSHQCSRYSQGCQDKQDIVLALKLLTVQRERLYYK